MHNNRSTSFKKQQISHDQYVDLVQRTKEFNEDKPYLRFGQTLFNLFYELSPVLADCIRGTSSDPFHTGGDENSKSVCLFYDWVVNKDK